VSGHQPERLSFIHLDGTPGQKVYRDQDTLNNLGTGLTMKGFVYFACRLSLDHSFAAFLASLFAREYASSS
jgi:hypothetical protein